MQALKREAYFLRKDGAPFDPECLVDPPAAIRRIDIEVRDVFKRDDFHWGSLVMTFDDSVYGEESGVGV